MLIPSDPKYKYLLTREFVKRVATVLYLKSAYIGVAFLSIKVFRINISVPLSYLFLFLFYFSYVDIYAINFIIKKIYIYIPTY